LQKIKNVENNLKKYNSEFTHTHTASYIDHKNDIFGL